MECKICNDNRFNVVYEGDIRSAGVGSEFVGGYSVLECKSCKIKFLSPFPENIKEFYESDEYRQHYDYTIEEEELSKKYDIEQNDRVYKIGIENLRNKIVGDFGCGVGLFLDAVKGISKRTVAVEPMRSFSDILKGKGHTYFDYPENVQNESLDIAVTFDTLEHIDNPIKYLGSIYDSVRKGGYLYLSIPNANDILMNVFEEIFQKFFYCKAHLFYYDINVLTYVIEKVGFKVIEKNGLHKYDFYNFVNWLKTGKPCDRKQLSYIDPFFESIFKRELVRLNMSSHLFIKAVKP